MKQHLIVEHDALEVAKNEENLLRNAFKKVPLPFLLELLCLAVTDCHCHCHCRPLSQPQVLKHFGIIHTNPHALIPPRSHPQAEGLLTDDQRKCILCLCFNPGMSARTLNEPFFVNAFGKKIDRNKIPDVMGSMKSEVVCRKVHLKCFNVLNLD